jgi:hypothetical protein
MKRLFLIGLLAAGMAVAVPLPISVWHGASYVVPEDLKVTALTVTHDGPAWTVAGQGHVLVMTEGRTQAQLDHQDWNLGAPPRVINDRLMLPFEDLKGIFGLSAIAITSTVVAASPVTERPPVVVKPPQTASPSTTRAAAPANAPKPFEPEVPQMGRPFGDSLPFDFQASVPDGVMSTAQHTATCKNLILGKLKTPSSARFSDNTFVAQFTDATFTVSGSVESDNSYGAPVRGSYLCAFRYGGGVVKILSYISS